MKKFMQVGLFMGTFLLSSQLFGQTTDRKPELPVCPVKTDAPKGKAHQESKKRNKFKTDPNFRVPAVAERKESH